MKSSTKLAGIAITLAAGIGAFGLVSTGRTTPALAAQAVAAATTQPAEAASQAAIEKPAVDCAKQAWPYVARECLAAADGTPVRKVTRTVTANAR